MSERRQSIAALSEFLHHHILWFLLGSYAVAALWPGPGLWVRNVSLGEIALLGEKMTITLPMLLLALVLVNAGLGVQPARLKNLARTSPVLLAGLAANLLIPVAFIFAVAQSMRVWHNPDEVQHILLGLALIASMPVAGSSTAWAQNGNGDLALSLGLVLLSTLLSPLSTPLALHAVGYMAREPYAADLHHLANQGTGLFLALCVALPSLMGIAGRGLIGGARIDAGRPYLKGINCLNLLLLNYVNGAVSLPQAVANPDWDFLAVTLGIAVGLCMLAFGSGWLLARWLGSDEAQRTSLMFGLGMNNNGTGLVLASMWLAQYPQVMLPIIFYNLVQHLVAGCATGLLDRSAGRGARQEPACVEGSAEEAEVQPAASVPG